MTIEVLNELVRAQAVLNTSGKPQPIRNLEFSLPNDLGLNGKFEAQLTGTGVDEVQFLLRGQGEPFIKSVTRQMLLSEAVALAPGLMGEAIRKLRRKINCPSSGGHVSVGRTRY